MEPQPPFLLKPRNILLGALVFLGLYLSSLYSYLLFHGIAEIFSVSVAGTVFMVSWSTRRSSADREIAARGGNARMKPPSRCGAPGGRSLGG